MADKITEIPNKERDEMQAAVENLKRNLPIFLEHVWLIAQIRKASYDALIEQGFTPEQALVLCQSTEL